MDTPGRVPPRARAGSFIIGGCGCVGGGLQKGGGVGGAAGTLARMIKAYIGLGANLGKRQYALRQALVRIGQLPGTLVLAVASFRETEPVGGPAHQPKYMNGAVGIQTELSALDLLHHLLEIEQQLGRDRSHEARFGPRTIDLDLLLYGQDIIQFPPSPPAANLHEGELVVPHPRMHLREFVLEPLAEIAPEVVHPVLAKSIGQLLLELRAEEKGNPGGDRFVQSHGVKQ